MNVIHLFIMLLVHISPNLTKAVYTNTEKLVQIDSQIHNVHAWVGLLIFRDIIKIKLGAVFVFVGTLMFCISKPKCKIANSKPFGKPWSLIAYGNCIMDLHIPFHTT